MNKSASPKSIFVWRGGSHGGAEEVMNQLADFFITSQGIPVTIGIFSGEDRTDLRFSYTEVPRLFPKKFVGFNTIAASLILRSKIGKYDMVVTHSGGYWKQKSNFFVYREPGNLRKLYQSLPLHSQLSYLLPYLIARRSLKKADCVIAASQQAEHYMTSLHIKHICSSTNFVDLKHLPAISDRPSCKDNFKIVFIGRDDPIKRLSVLVDVVENNSLPIEIHVFGVQGLSTIRVKYHGWQNPDVIDRFLQEEAHLFVLPSRFEASPVTLIRALAIGVPALVAQNALPDELIPHVKSFYDKRDLLEKLCECHRDYQNLAVNAQQQASYIREMYNMHGVLEREWQCVSKYYERRSRIPNRTNGIWYQG